MQTHGVTWAGGPRAAGLCRRVPQKPPESHTALHSAHLHTTWADNGASLPGTLPGLAMKVLHPKKLFRPRQPGPFDDPAITGLWFFSLPWSEGRLPAPAGPGGRRLWPSLWQPVSPAWQATSPYHPPGPRTPFQSHFPLFTQITFTEGPGKNLQKRLLGVGGHLKC